REILKPTCLPDDLVVVGDLFVAMRATDPPQRVLYVVRDPWPWRKPHEAAGVHRTFRRRGSGVAAYRTRPPGGGNAGRRIDGHGHARRVRRPFGRVPPRSQGNRLRRGS